MNLRLVLNPFRCCLPLMFGLVVASGGVIRAQTAPPAVPGTVVSGKPDDWKLTSGKFEVARDAALGTDVLTVSEGTFILDGQNRYTGAQELRARVRLRTNLAPSASAHFTVGKADAADAGFIVNLSASRGQNIINANLTDRGRALHDVAELTKKLDWGPEFSYATSFTYNLREYPRVLPGQEESYRAHIEDAMSRLPDLEGKWVDVRIQFRKGLIRAWLDDRLIATKTDASVDPQGTVKIQLTPGVQLASYTIKPLEEPANFQPIELAGYANARTLTGKTSVNSQSLPAAGKPAMVAGVPFIFNGVNPEGHDHIDVGQSFLRQANSVGYIGTMHGENARWHGTTHRDPARLQIRIPNDRYDNLYLIAASDGEANNIPIVSAMFYRPGAGFAQSFEARVPLATSTSRDAKPLGVVLSNGKKTNLWLVKMPLDREKLTAFSDMDIVEVELTKKVHQYRTYPDPISYGYHQGGLPSGVHIYAATFSRSPIVFDWQPDRFGHVWTATETASYTATVTNRSGAPMSGKLTVTTRSYDGTETTKQEIPIQVAAGQTAQQKLKFPVKLYGLHDIASTLDVGGQGWSERRSFVRLAPDTRSAKWTEGKGALFGYWSYGGGHYTPKLEHHVRLMMLAGARTAIGYPQNIPPDVQAMVDRHWSGTPAGAWEVSPQPWAADEPLDPVKVAQFQKEVVEAYRKTREAIPAERRPDHVMFYPEPGISARLSAGNAQEYITGQPLQYTEEEKQRIKMFFNSSKIAAEAVRKEFPGLKVLIPWGDPGFVWPLLRAGYPKDLIDGSGIDIPGFERIPERQLHEQSIHRLYSMKKEYTDAGIPNPRLQYIEGIFVPTEPGAVSYREQMDIYQRWVLISMGHGVNRFHSGWFAFDCGNYYGAEHYGGNGIQRRIPYCDPKPAYAAYATMTDKLNEANFDGWVKTGSNTTYCMRFKHATRGNIYALWTLRGKRPVTLTLSGDATAAVTDSMNNTKQVASVDNKITIQTNPSVIYVMGAGEITASVGEPDNSDVAPTKAAKVVAELGDGTWKYTSQRDEVYEKNHWGIYPALGKFSTSVATEPAQGRVLVSKLEKQDRVREFMPWYNTLTPARPVALSGAPSHLGLWVKGNSDWGRFIYVLRDAKGERWISIGTKDDYNCDDPHSWSSFNFDGWRYLRFELPGHLGWDNYRKIGTTWWGSSAKAVSSPTGKANGDDIVDLPVSLEKIIIEQRSHVLYVNDPQPAAGDTVSLGKLYVEYDQPGDATAEAVKLSRLRMPLPQNLPDLPNPIAQLTKEGEGAPTKLLKLTPPEHYYDGTRMHVHFQEVPGAKAYHLWVSAYPDGRGAINMVPSGIKSGDLVGGLRPAVKLYYWITYTGANDKESKPSPVHAEITVDNFKEK